MEEEMIDQSALANSVAENIKFEFLDYILVKPLDPIKVTKEFTKPVGNKPATDENGVEAVDFDKVETEVKEVDSDYRKGIVLKIPMNVHMPEGEEYPFKIGDVIVFKDMMSRTFDLLKDSRLVRYYDVIAVER